MKLDLLYRLHINKSLQLSNIGHKKSYSFVVSLNLKELQSICNISMVLLICTFCFLNCLFILFFFELL